MCTVLLVGEDALLQQTRAAVLRTTGATTVCCKSASALTIQADREFDMVVLCHSVPTHLCIALTEAIRACWPSTLILLVTSAKLWETAITDADVDAIDSADPELLVRRTMELLRRKPCQSEIGPTVSRTPNRIRA